MAKKALEKLLVRLDTILDKDIREKQLQKAGVSQSFRVNHTQLSGNLKTLYNLDKTAANKAATIIINSLNHKFKDFTISKGYHYYKAKSYGIVDVWKRQIARGTDTGGFGKDLLDIIGPNSPLFSNQWNLGHGSDTTLAAVEFRTLLAYKEWLKFVKLNKVGFMAIEAAFIDSPAGKKVTDADDTLEAISFQAFTAKGNIKKKFEIFLDLDLMEENLQLAAGEKLGKNQLKAAINKAIKEILDNTDWTGAEASPSVIKYVTKEIDRAIDGGEQNTTTHKSSSKKVKKKKKAARKVRAIPTLASVRAAGQKAVNAAKKAVVTSRLQDPRGRFTSLISTTSIINSLLYGAMKNNMTPPALQFRTGRLASSAKVTKMSFTREGQLTAFYTYMKRPYQTFERGHKQGNEFRDPRRLINKSIREVARMYIHKKFELKTRRL
jgi:hypothetical protein